jgi:hypothetical protein
MNKTSFPPGWDESRVRRVLEHYETQSDDEAVAEDEAACETKPSTMIGPPPLAVLRRVNARQVWHGEASTFTPWLAENLSALGEALGIDLELVQREVAVGDFALDILARDLGRDRLVIIENQLSPTNHAHLGQLLTYAAGLNAGAIVWIAESIRDDHRQALDWLNEHTDESVDFFGVVVEVLKIDDSRPACNFRLVASPNEWTKVTKSPTPTSDRREAYRDFFQKLIDELRKKHFTNARVGQPQNWYSFNSGISGITYGASFALGGRVRTEIYIRPGDAELNKSIFDKLAGEKSIIESEFGESLSWERLEDRKACRVAAYTSGSIENDERALEEIRHWMMDRLFRFRKVFGPRLRKVAFRNEQ